MSCYNTFRLQNIFSVALFDTIYYLGSTDRFTLYPRISLANLIISEMRMESVVVWSGGGAEAAAFHVSPELPDILALRKHGIFDREMTCMMRQ